ncbi:MAG: FAD-dependent oxidoreductase [Myxococcota bacterium]|nr:FAD-dependent oxidoreductase [Myxococcota bacterium]
MLLRRDPRSARPRGGLSDADVAIVGAGCAGLSLAWHLVERGLEGRRLVLVDPRSDYGRDRTWCFWNVVDHPFEDLVTHRWDRWRVRHQGPWVERASRGLRYEHLPSDAFYDRVIARLRRTPGVELRLGVEAGEVTETRDGASVETPDGPLRAPVVFDSRPPRRRVASVPGRDVAFLQHFEGWQIEADRDVFDDSVATLMDFAVPQEHGVHFFYVLPYGPRRALVEATWFGTEVPDEAVYRQALVRYIRQELGLRDWRVTGRERGVIPMSAEPMPVRISDRVYRIGLGGGMAKPSTGYAFQAIQTFSAEMAKRLDVDTLPEPPPPRTSFQLFQDRVFLSYLSRYTERMPATLVRLFERVRPELLARFLSDRTSPSHSLEVMAAMPVRAMTAETLRSHRLWLR